MFGLIQQGGRVIAKVVPNTQVKNLSPLILRYVKLGSDLYTDEWNYGKKADTLYNHQNVNHRKDSTEKGHSLLII